MKEINFEMKRNFNAMIMYFDLKSEMIYEQMLHKLGVKQEQRETEIEREE